MSIDVGLLLGDIIDDAARIGGGVIEIANAILDDPRIAVVALPKPDAVSTYGARWSGGDNDYTVYVTGATVSFGGSVHNVAEGDDPTAFVARVIAAYRHALKAVRS